MAIDVAGFSTMSERDQRRAARNIEALRARIDIIATRHGGRVFNTAGDGFMLEFPSAGAALTAISDLLDKRPRGEPAIRVGAHVGDVVVTIANDLLGHGVNVAARLQSLAAPNSALVSGEFRSMARNSPSAAFQAKGRQPLENIDQRVQTYAILSQRQRFKRRAAHVGMGLAALAIAAAGYFAYPHVSAFTQRYVAPLMRDIGAPKLEATAAGALAPPSAAAPSVAAAPQAPALPQAGEVLRDCLDCPELVAVKAGVFQMGSPAGEKGRAKDEGVPREVSIAAFAVGRYEVTFAAWDACANDGGCGGYYPPDYGWGRGPRPVVGVSWNDAQAYVQWLSAKTGVAYRLPGEAEWEYVARAGAATPYATGETVTAQQARFAASGPLAAGSFPANAFGVFDMAGNAAEWTADCYAANPAAASAVAPESCALRVYRGGGFADPASALRAAARAKAKPDVRNREIGFRVARALTP
ncbi:MAG: SUMF1/EgtB/PvdO family nonheme iron enzyme [Hyphomonadaceae bacterium]